MSEKKLTYKELLAERDAYKAENDALKRDRVNRQAKNSVFLNLFMRKKYQLKLYKELFPADTTITEDDLELVTLDNVLTIHPSIDQCIQRGYLSEYLHAHRAEVEKIMMTMLSPEYVKMASERTERIKASISTLRFLKMPETQIKDTIVKQYDLTPTYAQNFLDDDSDPEDSRPWAL